MPHSATSSITRPRPARAVELRTCGAERGRMREFVGAALPSHGRGLASLCPGCRRILATVGAGSSGAAAQTARGHTRHHALQQRLQCDGLQCEASWRPTCRGSLDGMQGGQGFNPPSSTRHNAAGHSLAGGPRWLTGSSGWFEPTTPIDLLRSSAARPTATITLP